MCSQFEFESYFSVCNLSLVYYDGGVTIFGGSIFNSTTVLKNWTKRSAFAK